MLDNICGTNGMVESIKNMKLAKDKDFMKKTSKQTCVLLQQILQRSMHIESVL